MSSSFKVSYFDQRVGDEVATNTIQKTASKLFDVGTALKFITDESGSLKTVLKINVAFV